jgi:hypothetical protein
MIAIMTASIANITMSQRFSVRATISSGTMPSGNGRPRGFEFASANGASRKEQQEVKSKPADEEQRDGDAGHDQGSHRSVPERERRFFGADRRCNVLLRVRGGIVRLVERHRDYSFVIVAAWEEPSTCWK